MTAAAMSPKNTLSKAKVSTKRSLLHIWLIWSARIATAIAAALLSAVAALYFLDWNTMRGPVSRYLSHRLGREVRINGNLRVNLLSWQPRVDLEGLWIGNPAWLRRQPAADVQHLTFEFRLLPLLFGGHWVLPLVSIDRPAIDIVRKANGRTNWQFTNNSQGADIPPIRRLTLNDGSVHIEDEARHLTFSGTVSSRESVGTAQAAFQLFGNGTLNGKLFRVDVRGGPLIHVDETRPYAFTADVRVGATHAVIDGQITKPFQLGHYVAHAAVTGSNLADLYDLTSLALPDTSAYRISGTLTRDGSIYRLSKFAGTVGQSDLHGDLAVDVSGKLPFLRATVASRMLVFSDLGPVIGQSSSKSESQNSLLPDTPFRVGRLRGTNAEVDYTADSIRSRDFPLRKLAAHISLENGVLLVKPLAFEFSRGQLAGSIRIDVRRPTTLTSADVRLSHVRIEQFIKGADKPLSGTVEARAVLTGEGNSVRAAADSANGALTLVVPDGRMRRSLAEWLGVNVISALGLTLASDTSDAGLRCALVHFKAQQGVFVAQQFMIDTEPVLVTGTGDIDLRDETMNITLAGKPKQFQLLRLNLPITVQGSLAHPAIGAKPGRAIAQAGIAAALGFLSPVAALLPFVDADLAKDANCAQLMTRARTKSAPVKVRTPHK